MQAAGATKFLTLVENSSSRLVVQQAAANTFLRFPMHLLMVVAIGLLIFFAVTRRWSWMLVPAILLVLAAVTSRSMPTYTVTVDNQARLVSWNTAASGGSEQGSVPVDALQASGLQSGKSGNRPVLVRKDGGNIYPLGTSYFMNEPVQLVLTQHIQTLIDEGNHR